MYPLTLKADTTFLPPYHSHPLEVKKNMRGLLTHPLRLIYITRRIKCLKKLVLENWYIYKTKEYRKKQVGTYF